MRRSDEIIKMYKYKDNLAEVPLEFVQEWHSFLNEKLSPSDVKPQSNKKVWWQCSFGHEWQASIQRRFLGDNCPCCNGKKVSKDNCLQNKNAKLAAEWNQLRNGLFTPNDVLPSSSKKVWWICEQGHEWEARIDNRNYGSSCPQCKKNKALRRTEW